MPVLYLAFVDGLCHLVAPGPLCRCTGYPFSSTEPTIGG